MRTLTLFLIALVVPVSAETRTIHGLVMDRSSRAIEGARVTCGSETVFTNSEGRFAIPAAPDCNAVIEKEGFEPVTFKLTAETENRITMTVQGPVETVVVTATRAQTTAEQAAVAANVVTRRELEARDYPPIADVLREIPGVQIVDSGRRGAVTSIFTRGSQSTGTLVLLDGVPLNDAGGLINLAHLTSTGIDRMEVVRGPESTLFGAEASAGVIQLFTRRGDPERRVPHGFASYERGNFDTDRWIAGLSGGFANRLDYSLTADQLHTVGEFPNDFYRNNSGTVNLGFRISDATQVRGIFDLYDAHLGSPGQVGYGAFDLAANQETRDSILSLRVDDSRGSRYFQRFAFGCNRLRDRFNDDEPFNTQPLAALVRTAPGAPEQVYFVGLLNASRPLPSPSQLSSGVRTAMGTAFFGPFGSVNLTERKTADYQGTLAQSEGSLVFGYGFQRQGGTISDTNVARDHHGFFVNEQRSFGGRLYVSAGARVEHSTVFGTEFVPRGGVSFLLFHEHGVLSSTLVRLSAGRGITEPSLYQNFVRAPFAQGNLALKPEKTNSYEAALVQEWFSRRVRSQVAVFRSSFTNLISYVYPSWQNIEASWARGIESSVEARLIGNVVLSGNYTRVYTRVTSSTSPGSAVNGIGQELLRRARNSGAVTLMITPRKWSLVIGARFVGERQDSDFVGFGVNRNPGYENVFLSASYRIAGHFTPVVRLDNLLNERYEEALGYTAPSRSAIGGLRIDW